MKKQQRYYTLKFNSDRLKKFNYDISISFEEAIKNNELIALFENQLIDCILNIQDREINQIEYNSLLNNIRNLKKKESSQENAESLHVLQQQLNDMMFVPEYITIEMNNKQQYNELYKNGIIINGIKYKRFNSSASQARVNTVLFIAETVFDELRKRTDNGRDRNKEIAPAKLNAYRGLYGSSRFTVSTPRFCVVKDYESPTTFKVNFVEETDYKEDDKIIEGKEVTKLFNRFDGQGLISPTQASKWAEELGLNYVPSQFCVRGSFLKGMLCVFDIHEFCKSENNGNYMVETIYKDKQGNSIMVDLRNVDVIITESQLKLWDSWNSVEHYNQCCEENGLSWGVSLYTPEFDKTFFYQNYQFLQTLNLDDNAIAKITEKFIHWIKGVTNENVYYTMLFLVGMNTNEAKFEQFINGNGASWIKALILEPKLASSKYFKTKIYNMLKKKIQNASLGQIIVDGNFQVIVSDPYAMMEHICGKEVKGLLGEKQHYSNYWNQLNTKQVVASRSPLTYRSEHVKLNLINDKNTKKWFKYCNSGIIINAHGYETDQFAGSDFDYDIIATTSDESVLNGVFEKELPIIYDPPTGKKVIPTDDDLYKADTFSFNSIIGGLTNKSTSGYALLATLQHGTREYEVTLNRIKSITKAQNAQIDKTKIGQNVKGIVPKWVKYEKPKNGESEEERLEREFNNRILLDKHPYFFINLYKGTKKKYKEHLKRYEILALQNFGKTLDEIKSKKRFNEDEMKFLDQYHRFSPVIESDCVMNKICKRIESVDFNIKSLLKSEDDNYHELFFSGGVQFDNATYSKVKNTFISFNKEIHNKMNTNENDIRTSYSDSIANEVALSRQQLKDDLFKICNNEIELTNYLVYLFYVDNKSANKDLLWTLFGEVLVENLKSKKEYIEIPVLCENGEIEYLNKKYTLRKVDIHNESE